MKKLPLTKKQFEGIYSKVPRVNVELIIQTKEGIVLTKRSMEPCIGKWHIPGGTIYFGETPETALARVAMDELGILIANIKLVGVICYPGMRNDGYFGWPIGIAYTAEIESGALRGSHQGEEVMTFAHIPPNTIEDQVIFLREHNLLT